MTITRLITLFALLFIALITNPLHASTPPNKATQIQDDFKVINDSNSDDLIVNMTNFYLENFVLLTERYKTYKNRDRSIFINWRNKEWIPTYENQLDQYNTVLKNNRGYLFSNNLIPMFSSLSNLNLVSLDFMKAIRDNNNDNLQKAKDRFKSDLTTFSKAIDERQLQDRIIFPGK